MYLRCRSLVVLFSLPLLALSASAAPAKFGAVQVGGVSIKNLDQTQAIRRLRRELSPKLKKRIGLAAGPKIVYRTRDDLGFALDIGKMLGHAAKNQKSVPVAFRVDQKRAAAALRNMQGALSTKPRDAQPVVMGKKVTIRSQQRGTALLPSPSAAKLVLEAEQDPTKTRFEMNVKNTAPHLTASQLRGINAIVGTFTTRFNAGQVKRTTNMRVAIKAINGTVLSRGETFSLNKTVGNRTQARGYRTAIIFEDGKKKPGLGGGVSQVTGTLFNAALVAGLPIVTYRVHSRPVTYLPLGRDATVAWGSFDMKFKNDTQGPIFIFYHLSGSHATATLLGHKTGKTASMRVVSKRNGARDISAVLFRTIRQDGKVVKKERVGGSHYNWKSDNAD